MKKKKEYHAPMISSTIEPENHGSIVCRTGVECLDNEYRYKLTKFVEYQYEQLCDMREFPNVDISHLELLDLSELHSLAVELETKVRIKLGIKKD